jgi:hypothetical protein
MGRFFATPSGKAFAAESLAIWASPEFMSLMGQATPEIVKVMPALMAKVEAATAHLPLPKPKKEEKESKRSSRR